MTPSQIKEAETIANKMASSKGKIFARETALAEAKSIQGLRAVFDEVYPDPVRVISVGTAVEDLLADPGST